MQYVLLGQTGLRVSVAGLGCGGNSRLGLGRGKSEADAIALVQQAIELGVNFFDTAASYTTESVVGKAIKVVPRNQVVISTKAVIERGGQFVAAEEIVASLEQSLRQLDTDYVDVFQLHMVHPRAYDHAVTHIAPALVREREKGKIRAIGISETSPRDHEHLMLRRALRDPVWAVVMFAFNLMNQNARGQVFPVTIANNIGTLLMFVVRNIFSQPGQLAARMRELAATGEVPQSLATDRPLDFLLHEGGASSVVDAAYRYARHEPGAHVILFGTGSPEHLRENIRSILKPPLPEADCHKLAEVFGHLLGIGLEFPKQHRDP